MEELHIKDLTLDQIAGIEQQIAARKAELEKEKDPFGHLPKTYSDSSRGRLLEALVHKSHEKSVDALTKLLVLRDEWREGWEPESITHGIESAKGGGLRVGVSSYPIHSISFDSSQKADAFLQAHRELIEAAGDLI